MTRRMAGGQYWPLRTWLASGPGQAVPVRRSPDPRRLEADVRLVRIRRLLRGARAVLRRELGHRVDDVPVLGPPTDHEEHARPVAGADEDVLGPGRAVEEVPRPQDALLPLDQQAALARKNEEVLLLRLAVVEAVRLAGLEHVQPDTELRKGGVPRLERAFGARRLLRARRLRRQPLGIGDVDDEPPLAHACEAAAAILELGVLHRANLHSWSERVLTLRELNRALLARQLLLERRKLGVQQTVERVCAIQAQWPQSPYIGLWTRLSGFRKEQLTRALEQHLVVKTQLFRITLHITSARDYPHFYAVWGPSARDRTPGVTRDKLEELTRRVRAVALERPVTQAEVEELAAEEMNGMR